MLCFKVVAIVIGLMIGLAVASVTLVFGVIIKMVVSDIRDKFRRKRV